MSRKLIIGIIIGVLVAAVATTTFLVSKSANSIEHQLELGYKYLEDGDYEEAILAFERALEIDENNIEAYIGLAETYVEMNEIDEAIDALEKAVDIDDDYKDVVDIMKDIAEKITDEMDADDKDFQDVFDRFVELMNELDGIDENESYPRDIENLLMMGGYYNISDIEQEDGAGELDNELDAENQQLLSELSSDSEMIISKVCAGGQHAIALKSDGSVWAWGSNFYGQLGNGEQTKYNEDYEISINNDATVPIKIFDDAIDISAGDNFTLILTKDNELYGCGSNEYGQLGLDEYINYLEPTFIAANVISIEARRDVSAYITSDNELYLLGLFKAYENFGFSVIEGEDYSKEPKFIMPSIQDVALGKDLMMILTMNNELYVSGKASEFREMSQGEDQNYTYTEQPIKLVDSVKTINSGLQVYMYTDFNDTLYTWGFDGSSDMLGTGTSEFHVLQHTKVLEDIIDYNQQIAIDKNGNLYVWGAFDNMVSSYSDEGCSGGAVLDTILDYGSMPIRILDNMQKCSLYDHTLYAIDAENNLYSWGTNIYGQIGDGTVTELRRELVPDGEYMSTEYTVVDEQGKQEPIFIMNLGE